MELVFATNNQNKFNEVKILLPPSITLLSLKDIGCSTDIPETQLTIEGNAIQKAEYIKTYFNKDCFADDTGLEVDALKGEPGVYSSRYAGDHKNNEDNIKKLLKKLENHRDRNAQFRTIIALYIGKSLITFEGISKGEIAEIRAGNGGFGYDSVFRPNNHSETFAQLPPKLKNKIGHRGKAIKKLVDYLDKYYS